VSLRYGYVTNGLTSHRLADALELLADADYEGVAITLDHVHFDPLAPDLPGRAADLRALLDWYGLAPVVETGARFALDPRRKHRPTLMDDDRVRRIDWVCAAIDTAQELQAPVVSVWSGALEPGADRDEAWRRLHASCEEILDHAAGRGVRVGFEPEPGMLVERIEDFDRLDRQLGRPAGLGITLDLGHCVCLEADSVARCIERASGRLVHVHADDMRRGVHEHLMFGDGELDTAAALGALRASGYEGLVAVELSRHAHAAHEVVPRAIEALRASELREVAA
jgi:sugar phosphate isomerase/epimerase